jgi:hypothetical protein
VACESGGAGANTTVHAKLWELRQASRKRRVTPPGAASVSAASAHMDGGCLCQVVVRLLLLLLSLAAQVCTELPAAAARRDHQLLNASDAAGLAPTSSSARISCSWRLAGQQLLHCHRSRQRRRQQTCSSHQWVRWVAAKSGALAGWLQARWPSSGCCPSARRVLGSLAATQAAHAQPRHRCCCCVACSGVVCARLPMGAGAVRVLSPAEEVQVSRSGACPAPHAARQPATTHGPGCCGLAASPCAALSALRTHLTGRPQQQPPWVRRTYQTQI